MTQGNEAADITSIMLEDIIAQIGKISKQIDFKIKAAQQIRINKITRFEKCIRDQEKELEKLEATTVQIEGLINKNNLKLSEQEAKDLQVSLQELTNLDTQLSTLDVSRLDTDFNQYRQMVASSCNEFVNKLQNNLEFITNQLRSGSQNSDSPSRDIYAGQMQSRSSNRDWAINSVPNQTQEREARPNTQHTNVQEIQSPTRLQTGQDRQQQDEAQAALRNPPTLLRQQNSGTNRNQPSIPASPVQAHPRPSNQTSTGHNSGPRNAPTNNLGHGLVRQQFRNAGETAIQQQRPSNPTNPLRNIRPSSVYTVNNPRNRR